MGSSWIECESRSLQGVWQYQMQLSLRLFLWVLIALLGIELASFLALELSQTSNPLAFPRREAWLHLFAPSQDGAVYSTKRNYRQTFRSAEFKTSVRTNNIGIRENDDFDGRRPDIAAVGDSFTFGHGVEVGERYSDRLREKYPSLQILTLAPANGFTTPHYYHFLQDRPWLLPKILIVGLFAFNDLGEDIGRTDIVEGSDGEIERLSLKGMRITMDGYFAHPLERDPESTILRWLRELYFGRALLLLHYRLLKDRSLSAAPAGDDHHSKSPGLSDLDAGIFNRDAVTGLNFIIRMRELLNRNGGRVVVLYIPYAYWVGDYPHLCPYDADTCVALRTSRNDLGNALSSWAATKGVRLIDPTESFRARERAGERLYFARDAHWNSAGHQAAADLIVRFVQSDPELGRLVETR